MVLKNIKRLNSKIEDITVNVNLSPSRIVSLDIIRGLFLISILIDHIELYPNGFDYFTGRGRLFVSAAEGFFFMSGLLVGMVYKRRLNLGMKFIVRKMWRRALVLYLASVFFTLLFTALAVFTNHQTIKYGLYNVINWPHIIKETVLMRYGYGWADFLDRFALLMFIAPFAFYLLTKGKWWLMSGISFLFWLWGQFGPQDNNFTITWQFLFNMAMLLGFYWPQINARWQSLKASTKKKIELSIVGVSAITFLFSYASVYILSVLNEKLPSLPHWLYNLTLHWNSFNSAVWVYAQKWTLGPLRLVLFALWFSVLFMLINKYSETINRYTRYLVELLGRNSLLVYIEHAFIVFAFKYYIPPQTNFWQNFLFTAGALVALFIVTIIYKNIEPNVNKKVNSIIRGIKKPFLKLLVFSVEA
ncbi:MAG TPA: OpgC domain-containing protein [Candidatus Saccharimonadales bacterium]|nr:OpgC domain-containing protein [Candidatus Saccharimonadales bacterium]